MSDKKNQTRKKFELCQNDWILTEILNYIESLCVKMTRYQIFTEIYELYQVKKCFTGIKLYRLKALLSKNGFCLLCQAKSQTIF